MPYAYIYTSSNSIEDGTYEVSGNELRLEHSGGGVSKCKLKPGEDPKTAACKLLREHVEDRGGAFYAPIHYPPKGIV
jgi:hypothetical protein